MKSFTFESTSEQDTVRLGAALATTLPASAVVALNGPLGAGKTRLVQALAEAAGVDRRAVVSPTFVLLQEYPGPTPIYHFDAYRLRDDDEFLQLGAEEYFAQQRAWCLIEWAERVESCLPRERLEIHIDATGDTTRRFEMQAIGVEYEAALDRLAVAIEA